jgi:hypothetical protein
MNNSFAILWTATQPGRSGLGTRRFSKNEAEELAKQLNEEHPEFLHRAIDLTCEDPAVVLAAMKSGAAAAIANNSQSVEAEAAVVVSSGLVPKIDEKVVWLKPEVSPADASAA